jgi:hypothetical protein
MHPHFCDCDECLNRSGGVLLTELSPQLPRYGYPSLPFRRRKQVRTGEQKRAQNARAYLRRKLRGVEA